LFVNILKGLHTLIPKVEFMRRQRKFSNWNRSRRGLFKTFVNLLIPVNHGHFN
uniref:Transposase n=1 Tax=Rodentolepis nana TaxID=102285 RepID=A0A0R3TTY1_RODNA